MKGLIAAIQFLTIIPMGKPTTYDPKGMIPYFPIVGMILGTLVSIFDHVALQLWSKPVVAILDVILLLVLTGAFHLDGLGDSADGLMGHRSREKVLAIMKDSRIGVMGYRGSYSSPIPVFSCQSSRSCYLQGREFRHFLPKLKLFERISHIFHLMIKC